MISFSTKANTLKSIEHVVKSCRVLPQICITVGELLSFSDIIKKDIDRTFNNSKVIVRSSAQSEDQEFNSLAGKFSSFSNLFGSDEIIEACYEVAKEYVDRRLDNQIFIQPMVENVKMSGVIFTVEPNTGGNYYIINYDESSGKTDSVTSGNGEKLQTYYLFHGGKSTDKVMSRLIEVAEELMSVFNKNNLDIEFAVDDKNLIYLLQVRPLTIYSKSQLGYEEQSRVLENIYKYISSEMAPKPFLYGSSTVYGNMPDWNPAEIIGSRPKPLSVSIYKYLITDKVWARQRENYGYKSLNNHHLMVNLGGIPYIDVRVSFNSFIPEDLDKKLSEKLVDFYIEDLRRHPQNHDKVEFETVYSCYTFSLDRRINKLKENGFSEKEIVEIKQKLLALTNNIINNDGYWESDLQKIQQLEDRRNEILNSTTLSEISKIYWLLQDCIEYGTLPFAGLARSGFIAIELLRSLVNENKITYSDFESFLLNINTISSLISSDFEKLSREDFLINYGHLRPGTYDITSNRYDATPDNYFGSPQKLLKKDFKEFKLSIEQETAITTLMSEHGIVGDVKSLFNFIRSSIEGREYAKFVFSKNLSDVLELIVSEGSKYGYSREDLSYLDIEVFLKLYSAAIDVKEIFEESILLGRKMYQKTLHLSMPPLIMRPNDIYNFHLPENQPNYITQKVVSGDICSNFNNWNDIQGKIILINSADPGYDWIFTCGILGFITAYGGANSHMAIRANELGIPAVIGVGEKIYKYLKSSRRLFINCANKKIEVIR